MATVRRIYVETATDRRVFTVTDDDVAPMIGTARQRLREEREKLHKIAEQHRLAEMRVRQAERWQGLCDALEITAARVKADPDAALQNAQAVRAYERSGHTPMPEPTADAPAQPTLAP